MPIFLAAWLAKSVAFLAGAKRWFNAEAVKALSFALVAVAVLIGLVLLYGAGGSAKEAKVNWKWLTQIATLNKRVAERRAADMASMAEASAQAQELAERQRDAAIEQVRTLESEIAKMGAADAIVISRDERRRLFK